MKNRPKRVWILCIMLGLLASFSLVANLFMQMKPEIAAEIGMTRLQLVLAAIPPMFLIFSIVALIRKSKHALILVIAASCLHLGIIIVQNASILITGDVPSEYLTKITANVVRTSLELGIVFWIMFSQRTRMYLKTT